MAARRLVLGSFKEEGEAASAIEALKKSSWELDRVHTPFPSHKISEALKGKKSRVGYFTLTGAIIGFFSGFALAVYTAAQWNIIVGGKPVVAWIPFLIVGFEFTILFAVFGNVLGLLTQARLPAFDALKAYDSRFSGEYFGVVAACDEGEEQKLKDLLTKMGGEVKAFEE
jgi:hypothetical protein